jgi:ATP-dependent exoDNAse (exonuclease V) beta subunit
MKWNKLYNYPKTIRSSVDGVRKYDVNNEKLPSVTTILKATESEDKKESLARWKDRVGEVEADRIKNVAALRGTAMHTYLEHYVKGGNVLDLTDVGREASSMGQMIIDKGFPDLEEVWGVECTLHYPGLYAGQTDMCGIYQGRESIIDFKQSNKPKRAEWIDDYKLQLVAYATAHDQVYGTKIEQGVILMCTPDNFFQRFLVNGSEFREWKWEWLRKIDQYYNLVK